MGPALKIAYITETFLPKVDGVVTRLLRTLEALDDLGHEALILAPPGAPSSYRRHRVVSAAGLPFPWYPELTAALPVPAVSHALSDFAPDVVHVVNPVGFGAWGVLEARRRGLPLVASFHTDPKVLRFLGLGLLTRPLEILDREIHNLAHLSLCTSPQMVALARTLGVKRVRLWAKAVDSVRFHPARRDPAMRRLLGGGEPDKPLLLYVGRLSREKKLDLLAPALRALPGVRLAFVGSGPDEAALRRRFHGTPTVFTGYLSGADLASAYASADLFAFPSDTETLGFVVMEAMAAGLAVVGADAGGVPDIVRHGENGLLFRPGDAGDLTAKLRALLDDPGLQRRLAGCARSEMERLTWRAATERLLQSYRTARRVQRVQRSRPRLARARPSGGREG